MAETPPTNEIQAALHGERVGQDGQIFCDYHDDPKRIPPDEPIMADCIRVVDLPDWELLLDPPDTWLLDAVRCRDCGANAPTYPTTGYEEALIMVSLTDANGILSVDASTLRVIHYSPADEGHAPPETDSMLAEGTDDAGIARWSRLIGWLQTDPPAPVSDHLEQLIDNSPDAPTSSE